MSPNSAESSRYQEGRPTTSKDKQVDKALSRYTSGQMSYRILVNIPHMHAHTHTHTQNRSGQILLTLWLVQDHAPRWRQRRWQCSRWHHPKDDRGGRMHRLHSTLQHAEGGKSGVPPNHEKLETVYLNAVFIYNNNLGFPWGVGNSVRVKHRWK